MRFKKELATAFEDLYGNETYELVVINVVGSALVRAQSGAVGHRSIGYTIGSLPDRRPYGEGAVVVEQDGECLCVRSRADGGKSKSGEFHGD